MASKRPIIKTRPQRPYVIARIILLLALVGAVAAAVVHLERAPAPAHGGVGHAAQRVQEAVLAAAEGPALAASTQPGWS